MSGVRAVESWKHLSGGRGGPVTGRENGGMETADKLRPLSDRATILIGVPVEIKGRRLDEVAPHLFHYKHLHGLDEFIWPDEPA